MKKKSLFSIFIFVFFILIATKVQASSASISISPTNPKVGEQVTVSVAVSNVNTVAATVNISGVINDTIKLVDGSLTGEPRTFSTSKTYTCGSTGNLTATMTSSSTAVLKGNYVDISASASTVVISNISTSPDVPEVPSTPAAKSSNANLSNLGIRPNDFTGFKPGTTTYNATVPYDVESVEVYAVKQDSKASVTGTGRIRLKEGTNVARVVVTAEDGTQKTYTMIIVRQSEEVDVGPNVIDETQEEKPENLRLTAIVLQNDLNLQLQPAFDSEIFEYVIEVEEWLEKFEVTGIPNLNSATIEVKGNDALTEENNTITITVRAEGYEDTVYTIKVVKKDEPVALNSEEEQQQEQPTQDNLDNVYQKRRMIAIIAIGILAVIAIILVILLKIGKSRKRLNASYYDYQHDYFSENGDEDKENQEEKDNLTETEEVNQNEDIETPQGYTAEIETDEDYENKTRRKRGKGKHF